MGYYTQFGLPVEDSENPSGIAGYPVSDKSPDSLMMSQILNSDVSIFTRKLSYFLVVGSKLGTGKKDCSMPLLFLWIDVRKSSESYIIVAVTIGVHMYSSYIVLFIVAITILIIMHHFLRVPLLLLLQ